MQFLPANRLRLYRNFKAIEAQDFHGTVRFYEQYEEGIRALDFEEYFDCTFTYTNALFETMQFGKHGVMCDFLLETIIMQNLDTWGGEDIYARILYDKAVSLYYLREYAPAEHVMRELIKIHPYHTTYLRLLNKCMLRRKPAWLMTARAVALALILCSAVFVGLELFVVKPFFPEHDQRALWVHYASLAAGLVVLFWGESRHVWRCRYNSNVFAAAVRERKKRAGSGN